MRTLKRLLKKLTLNSSIMSKHIPVLLQAAIDGLNIKKDGIYVDLTLGRAGHASQILSRLDKGLLIGIDQDEEAIRESNKVLSKLDKNYLIKKENFVNLRKLLAQLTLDEVDGILMDLGVSSPQFDEASRGFSYREDAKLDMRMDQSSSLTAYQIVNTYSLERLTKVFQEYGEDKYSYQIAKNIVKARQNKEITTTLELVDIIKASKPKKELLKIGHPAKQIFQALRIEVNDELNVLKEALKQATDSLKRGGRLVVITFHSLEDRIVKNYFKALTVVEGDRINLPTTTKEIKFKLITRKAIKPTEIEIANNHRSASAKLRIIERIK